LTLRCLQKIALPSKTAKDIGGDADLGAQDKGYDGETLNAKKEADVE